MATITKRKNGWSAQVRRKGYATRTKTFPTKGAATAWAREQEGLIDQGRLPVTEAPLKQTTLSQLIARYLKDVTPRKLSATTETQRLSRIQKEPIAALRLAEAALRGVQDPTKSRSMVAKRAATRRRTGCHLISRPGHGQA